MIFSFQHIMENFKVSELTRTKCRRKYRGKIKFCEKVDSSNLLSKKASIIWLLMGLLARAGILFRLSLLQRKAKENISENVNMIKLHLRSQIKRREVNLTGEIINICSFFSFMDATCASYFSCINTKLAEKSKKNEGYLIVSLFSLSCWNLLWRLLICSGETAGKMH